MKWQNAKVASIKPLSPSVSSFLFDLPEPFGFVPGQHVDVRLTAPDGYRAQRSYSIASAPSEGARIELAIEKLENGEVSPFFHEVVAVGDEIEMRGPIGGHFVWTPDLGGPVLMIAGGSGVMPFISMLRHRAAIGSGVPVALLYSVRTRPDLLYGDELMAMRDAKQGFTLTVTLSREKLAINGFGAGRIDAGLIGTVISELPAPPALVLVCGSNAFVNTAADGAIAAGVPSDRIKTERYGA